MHLYILCIHRNYFIVSVSSGLPCYGTNGKQGGERGEKRRRRGRGKGRSEWRKKRGRIEGKKEGRKEQRDLFLAMESGKSRINGQKLPGNLSLIPWVRTG